MAAFEVIPLLDSLLSGHLHTASSFRDGVSRLQSLLPLTPPSLLVAARDTINRGLTIHAYDPVNSQAALKFIESGCKDVLGLTFTLKCGEFTPLQVRRSHFEELYLDEDTAEDALVHVVDAAKAVNRLTHALDMASKRRFNLVFSDIKRDPTLEKCKELTIKLAVKDLESAQKATVAAAFVRLLTPIPAKKYDLTLPGDRSIVVKPFLALALNAEKQEKEIQSVLLKWKSMMIEDKANKPDLFKPAKMNRALERIARNPLRTGLTEIQRDRKIPAQKLTLALLKSARLPLNTGLNAIKSTSNLVGVHRFSDYVSDLDLLLNRKDPLTVKSAFWLWSRNVGKIVNIEKRKIATAKQVVINASCKEGKAISLWRSKVAQNRVKRAVKGTMLAVKKIEKVGIDRLAAPLRKLVGAYPRLRNVMNSMNSAIFAKERFGFEAWRLFANRRRAGQEAKDAGRKIKAQKFAVILATIPKKNLCRGFDRTVATGTVLHLTMMRLVRVLMEKPKAVVKDWHMSAEDFNEKEKDNEKKALLLQGKLLKVTIRLKKETTDRICGKDEKVKNAVRAILLGFTRKPKDWFAKWRHFVSDIKEKKLLDANKAEKLKYILSLIPSRTAKDAVESFKYSPEKKMKSILRGMIVSFNEKQKRLLDKWKASIIKMKEEEQRAKVKAVRLEAILKNTVRRPLRSSMPKVPSFDLHGQKLKACFEPIPKPLMKCWIDKLMNRNSLTIARLGTLIQVMKNFPRLAFVKWRDFSQLLAAKRLKAVLNGRKLSELISKASQRTLKTAQNRIVDTPEKLKKSIIAIIYVMRIRPKSAFSQWQHFINVTKSTEQRTATKGQSLKSLLSKFLLVKLRPTVDRLKHNNVPVLTSIESRILQLAQRRKSDMLQAIREFVFLQKSLDKLKSAHKTLELASKDDRETKRKSFLHWMLIVHNRKRALKTRVVFSFIGNTALTLQSSFWKWKTIKAHPEYIFPHQVSFFKSVGRVLNRVQRISISKAFEMISLGRMRHLMAEAGPLQFSPIRLHSLASDLESYRSHSQTNTEEDELPNPNNIRVIVNNKLSSVEANIVKQLGGFETFGLTVKGVLARNLVTAFVSIQSHSALQELKETNEVLIEDLCRLQEGNEKLMATFKESTVTLDLLSRKLEVIKTERLVRMLEKVRTLLPAYEAVLMLKMNAGIAIV